MHTKTARGDLAGATVHGRATDDLRRPGTACAGHATLAWQIADGRRTVVYASDVAALTAELEHAATGAALLVIDGAMWKRSLYTHLRIDSAAAGASSGSANDLASYWFHLSAVDLPCLLLFARTLLTSAGVPAFESSRSALVMSPRLRRRANRVRKSLAALRSFFGGDHARRRGRAPGSVCCSLPIRILRSR